jgi:hypothetical protein
MGVVLTAMLGMKIADNTPVSNSSLTSVLCQFFFIDKQAKSTPL